MNESISYSQKISAIIVVFFLGLISCNITLPSERADETEEASVSMVQCYLYTHGRDSVYLSFTQTQDEVEGNLHFDNYQIDGSAGTVKGAFKGDTLVVEYDFMAEGTRSKTEEVFLKQDSVLIRGLGEPIRFDDGQRFRLTDCR